MCEAGCVEVDGTLNFGLRDDDVNFRVFRQTNAGCELDLSLLHNAFQCYNSHVAGLAVMI